MTFEAFVQELSDPAQPVAASKLVQLSNMGPGEVSTFSDAWPRFDAGRRQRLVHDLVEIAEDNIELNFDAAFLFALHDDDPDVRRAAIQGLWEYEGRDLIEPLIELLLGDAEAAVRADAAIALGRFVLQAEFDSLRPIDGERVEESLRAALERENEVAEVRGRALESLAARSDGWVQDLIDEAHENGDRRLRLSAVHAMGRSCDPAWLPTLLPELRDDDAEMRFEAAAAAGAIGDEVATEYLLPLLEDEDAEVQEAAIAALGEIGGGQARAALQSIAADGDDRLKEAATAALTELDLGNDPLGYRPGASV